ncbi:MAG: DUF1007 family protein [Campylobacterota bacterium]|nr:DUF1007 family protein [Campylobacterota bacterium]
MNKFLLFLLITTSLFSHPHTFIDIYPTIKKDKPNTINFKWKLDEMTSSMLMMDLDQNMDGKFDANEIKFIEDEYFSMFIPYSYYTYIFINGKKQKLSTPKNFNATIENHQICYAFDIKLPAKLENIYFEFGDTDFYNALILKDKFINTPNIKTKIIGVDNDFYYGYRLEFP